MACGPLTFPAARTANLIRGGLGAALRQISDSAYARLFEPRASVGVAERTAPAALNFAEERPRPAALCATFSGEAEAGADSRPSGLADWPRPFVLRAAHLEGLTVARDSSFDFGVHLFDMRPNGVSELTAGFAQWGRNGVGHARTPILLTAVDGETPPITLSLFPSATPVRHITVNFLTPTELKGMGWSGADGLPPFQLLASRVRDRLSTLRALYGEGPLPIDFREFARRASGVRTVGGQLRLVEARRRSRATGQTHSLGGFTGWVEYEGDLGEFVPYLRAASFTGVGRQTTWGKGEIHVDVVD